jgi:hypothetical protein
VRPFRTGQRPTSVPYFGLKNFLAFNIKKN